MKRRTPACRFVPIVLQKSPSELCEMEICNYESEAPFLLILFCVSKPDFKSFFLAKCSKYFCNTIGTNPTCRDACYLAAFGGKAVMAPSATSPRLMTVPLG